MAKIKTPVGSKSERARAMYAAGKSVSDVEHGLGIGYAFAYGIAARMPHPDGGTYATRAANRRPTRTVAVKDGIVTVQTSIGPVVIHPDGRVVTPKRAKIAK